MDQAAFLNLLLMAASDGRMAESELRLLSHRAAEWGITDDQFEEALELALTGRAELTIPPDADERRQLLKELVRMMAADGKMCEAEKRLFALCSGVIGIEDAELNRLIDEVLQEEP